ncbi:hypothetical protein ACFQE4_13270 [Streptomyces thermocoprophilus]|uniref:hypothetical protein n=1 Tax=Streptomyces thermocoprophilus TaxID=78356 RepID=UPI00362419DE
MKRTDLSALTEGGLPLTFRALRAVCSAPTLRRRLRAEGWVRIRRGIRAEPGRALDPTTRLRAVQPADPRLVVSHGSAAGLWPVETVGAGGPGLRE